MRDPVCPWSLVSTQAQSPVQPQSLWQQPCPRAYPDSHCLPAPTALTCWRVGVGGCFRQVRAEDKQKWVGPTLAFLGTDLQEVMATSRDQKELLWAWQGWRDAVGRQLRITFERYVQLSNKAANLNGEALTLPPPSLKPPKPLPPTHPAHPVQMAHSTGLGGKAKQSLQGVKAVVGPGDGDPEPCSWEKQRWLIHHWSANIA